MILEEATFEAFGYELFELLPKSNKLILAACDNCGKVRTIKRSRYCTLCRSCSMKGKHLTEETKCKMSEAKKGNTNCLGHIYTEEHKRNISENHADQRGDKNPNYKGGKKVVKARSNAKRRGLGHILLNTSFKGGNYHHITHNFVIYMPKVLHRSVWHNINTCQGMESINTLALDFLVNGF